MKLDQINRKNIFEGIYQATENLVHIFEFQDNYLDKDKPWTGILSYTDFVA